MVLMEMECAFWRKIMAYQEGLSILLQLQFVSLIILVLLPTALNQVAYMPLALNPL